MALPIPRMTWPITVDATNDTIVFTCNAGPATYTGSVAHGTYSTPEAFLAALQTAINAATRSGGTFTGDHASACAVDLTDAGFVTLAWSNLVSNKPILLWSTDAVTQALGVLLGFSEEDYTDTPAMVGGATTTTAPNQIQHFWSPGCAVEADSGNGGASPFVQPATVTETAGGQSRVTLWGDPVYSRSVKFSWLAASKLWTAAEGATTANQALQRLVTSAGAGKFTYSPDRSDPTTNAVDYYLKAESVQDLTADRYSPSIALYSRELRFGKFILG